MSGIYVDQPEIKQKTVSTERAQNSLWLVKVPKYVAERLQKCEVGSKFGVIQTQRTPAGPEVMFLVCVLIKISLHKCKSVLEAVYFNRPSRL